MKKIVLNLTITFTIVASLVFCEYIMNRDFVMVSTTKIATKNIDNYVEATGEVSENNKREVYYDYPLKVSKVFVKVGKKVSRGETLVKFDKAPLLAKLSLLEVTGNHETAQMANGTPLSSASLISLKAGVENASEELICPINGVVTSINCTENADADTNKALITISDLDNLIVKAQLNENQIADVFVSQDVMVENEVTGAKLKGKVKEISPVAEKNDVLKTVPASVPVTIELLETDSSIKPGYNVDIKFIKNEKTNTIIIPFESILYDENKLPYVFVNSVGYALKKYVVLGDEFETEVEVIKGINESDELILNPKINGLKEGSKLQII